MYWSCGITTIPKRESDLLPRTIASVQDAGFKPRLFFDGRPSKSYNLPVTVREENIGAWGNWWLGMYELWIRDYKAQRFIMFQDDIVCCKNLRKYLEHWYPDKGYLNLYCNREYEKYVDKPDKLKMSNGRWFCPKRQGGQGALALVFSRDALKHLFLSRSAVEKPLTTGKRRTKPVDGGIVQAMGRNSDWYEWVHKTSLVQHTGHNQSTLGNNNRPPPDNFPGEDFDAMSYLKDETIQAPEPSKAVIRDSRELPYKVSGSLAIMGIDPTPVELWFARQCKCHDRKDKEYQLDQWADRVLKGTTEDMEKYLEEILEPCCD